MNKRIRNVVLSISFVFLMGAFSYFIHGKESKIHGFPVPLLAKYVEDDQPHDYQYTTSSFLYSMTLRVNGWKNTYHEGESYAFDKDGREVMMVKPTGSNSIYLFENK